MRDSEGHMVRWVSLVMGDEQGPTSTRYSNRTRIFLYYSNPTRKFLKNDRVASSMYSSHFRKIAALPCCSKDKVTLSEHQMPKAEQGMTISLSKTWFCLFCIFCFSWYRTFLFWQKFYQRSSWKSRHLTFLSRKPQAKHESIFSILMFSWCF